MPRPLRLSTHYGGAGPLWPAGQAQNRAAPHERYAAKVARTPKKLPLLSGRAEHNAQPAQPPVKAKRPNEKWVTEFNVKDEKLYLSPVLDLFNREIAAYEVQPRAFFPLIGNMLKKPPARLATSRPRYCTRTRAGSTICSPTASSWPSVA